MERGLKPSETSTLLAPNRLDYYRVSFDMLFLGRMEHPYRFYSRRFWQLIAFDRQIASRLRGSLMELQTAREDTRDFDGSLLNTPSSSDLE